MVKERRGGEREKRGMEEYSQNAKLRKTKKLHFNVPVAIMMPGAAVHDFIGE